MRNTLTATRFIPIKVSDKRFGSSYPRRPSAAAHPGVLGANLHPDWWRAERRSCTSRSRGGRGGRWLSAHTSPNNFLNTQHSHKDRSSSLMCSWTGSADLLLGGCEGCTWTLQWWSTCPCCQMIHLQVCLPRKPLTHSLLSPDGRKHLIYSGFKDTFFSLPYDLASQEVASFSLNPTKQALMASRCLAWVGGIQPRQRHMCSQLL